MTEGSKTVKESVYRERCTVFITNSAVAVHLSICGETGEQKLLIGMEIC